MKTIKLNKQVKIPVLGLGTWQVLGNEAQNIIKKALDIGYRHIDTAEIYNNQKQIGKTLKQFKIPRKEIFITSKVWRTNLRKKDVFQAVETTLQELQTNYLDLYLIHWPNKNIPVKETLEAMAKLKKQGKIKAIGVSNFTINHLKEALKVGVEIAVNQVEYHPSLNQQKLKDFCDNNNIKITAYSPLGQGQDLKLDLINKLAKKYNKPESQVVLNWLLAKGIIAIPRSTNPKHLRENYKTLEWNLQKEDIQKIDNLNMQNRILAPAFAEFDY